MHVDWGSSLIFKAGPRHEHEEQSQLWSEMCRPRSTCQLEGNTVAITEMKMWFDDRLRAASGDACLVVKGPSGVGKSTAVALCAEERGFHVEHTYANVSRTPQKMESILRKLTMHSQRSVLVLDDFESFIAETTSMRDIVKFARAALRGEGNGQSHKQTMARTIVIVCNGMDKTFEPVFGVSTVIEFDLLEPAHVQRALQRVARRVSSFCYVPPMDIFFIAHGSAGDMRHTINQMQLSHSTRTRGKRNGKRLLLKSEADSAFRNWSTTHTSTSLDCFSKAKGSIIDYIWSMSKGFHMNVRDNLHRDYPLYFHNSTCTTLDSMWKVAEQVSACDTSGPEEEDALYDTENSDLWGTDNTSAVAHISSGIWLTHGRRREDAAPKKRKRKKIFLDSWYHNSDVTRKRVTYPVLDKL